MRLRFWTSAPKDSSIHELVTNADERARERLIELIGTHSFEEIQSGREPSPSEVDAIVHAFSRKRQDILRLMGGASSPFRGREGLVGAVVAAVVVGVCGGAFLFSRFVIDRFAEDVVSSASRSVTHVSGADGRDLVEFADRLYAVAVDRRGPVFADARVATASVAARSLLSVGDLQGAKERLDRVADADLEIVLNQSSLDEYHRALGELAWASGDAQGAGEAWTAVPSDRRRDLDARRLLRVAFSVGDESQIERIGATVSFSPLTRAVAKHYARRLAWHSFWSSGEFRFGDEPFSFDVTVSTSGDPVDLFSNIRVVVDRARFFLAKGDPERALLEMEVADPLLSAFAGFLDMEPAFFDVFQDFVVFRARSLRQIGMTDDFDRWTERRWPTRVADDPLFLMRMATEVALRDSSVGDFAGASRQLISVWRFRSDIERMAPPQSALLALAEHGVVSGYVDLMLGETAGSMNDVHRMVEWSRSRSANALALTVQASLLDGDFVDVADEIALLSSSGFRDRDFMSFLQSAGRWRSDAMAFSEAFPLQ